MQFSISVIPGPAFTYPNIYSETLLYEHPLKHLIITDSFLCPWGKKILTYSLNSICLIQTLSMAPLVSVLTGFDCSVKPCIVDTSLIWTPHYYGQFSLSWENKILTFSKNSARLILTPHNMDTFYGPLSICINPLSPKIQIQILQTDLHTFLLRIVERIWFKIKAFFLW